MMPPGYETVAALSGIVKLDEKDDGCKPRYIVSLFKGYGSAIVASLIIIWLGR